MSTKIKIRRDIKSNWESINPVLDEGEIGYIKDTGHVKIGDGVNSFNDLNIGRFVECLIDARQSSDLWGKEIYFDSGVYIITTRAFTTSKDIDYKCYDNDDNEITFSVMSNNGRDDNTRWSGTDNKYRMFYFSYSSRFSLIFDALNGVAQGTQDFIYTDGKRYISNRSYISPVTVNKLVFDDKNIDGTNDNTLLRLRILRIF